jgi:hypothetical protein
LFTVYFNIIYVALLIPSLWVFNRSFIPISHFPLFVPYIPVISSLLYSINLTT